MMGLWKKLLSRGCKPPYFCCPRCRVRKKPVEVFQLDMFGESYERVLYELQAQEDESRGVEKEFFEGRPIHSSVECTQ